MNTLNTIAKSLQKTDFRRIEEIDFLTFADFNYYRLVDPLEKRVYSYENGSLNAIANAHCYDVWKTGDACEYCVSSTCLTSKESKNKMEQIDGRLYFVKTIPVLVLDRKLVLELIEDISDSYIQTNSNFSKLSSLLKELNILASLDSFTNLYSHGFMTNKIYEIININKNEPLCLVCMDIDNMKSINDTLGHVAGDETIKAVAKVLLPFKSFDNIFPGRTGGDEFQIIFQGLTYEEAHKIIVPKLANLRNIPIKDGKYMVSVSWALGEWQANQSAPEFLDMVDSKMYEFKRSHEKRKIEELS